jgi:signal transduction histidine kinase
VLIVLVVLGSSISASLWNTMWLVAALISREALLAQERDRAQQAERAMEERTRIARELHDGVWRWLNLAYVQLVICERCLERDPQHALEEIKVAKHYVAESQQEARQTMYTLRAEAKFDQPLPDLLRPAIDELQATGIDVQCDVLGPSRILDARTHAALIRVVQEGLTNVRRHAQATEVVITIEYCRAKRVHLRICDNGIGMPELVPGLGLTGMHERIAELQGDFTIETSCGQGVCIHVEVPG